MEFQTMHRRFCDTNFDRFINIFEIIFINLSQNNVYMCISDQKISSYPSRLGLFPCVRTTPGGTSVRRTCSTMTSRRRARDGVDATVNTSACFTFVHPYFISQQSVKVLSAMPKILCACTVFFCWWINYGRNSRNGKHATTAQFVF